MQDAGIRATDGSWWKTALVALFATSTIERFIHVQAATAKSTAAHKEAVSLQDSSNSAGLPLRWRMRGKRGRDDADSN